MPVDDHDDVALFLHEELLVALQSDVVLYLAYLSLKNGFQFP